MRARDYAEAIRQKNRILFDVGIQTARGKRALVFPYLI